MSVAALVASLLLGLCTGPDVVSAPTEPADPVEDLGADLPTCPKVAKTCIGIDLHVAVDGTQPVVDGAWLRGQLATANRLYADVGVGFEVATLRALAPSETSIDTRTQRDLLGRKRFARGPVLVLVVGRLANVDEPGEIYGVHWRDRARTSRRWIILSRIAWDPTLAHELGHYFGLPHCDLRGSIMNKTGNDSTPWKERGFVPTEVRKLKRGLRRKLKSGALEPRGKAG